ncbi:MAG: hypothetical protein Q9171_006825 [Xanthocarpia ochracea]
MDRAIVRKDPPIDENRSCADLLGSDDRLVWSFIQEAECKSRTLDRYLDDRRDRRSNARHIKKSRHAKPTVVGLADEEEQQEAASSEEETDEEDEDSEV